MSDILATGRQESVGLLDGEVLLVRHLRGPQLLVGVRQVVPQLVDPLSDAVDGILDPRHRGDHFLGERVVESSFKNPRGNFGLRGPGWGVWQRTSSLLFSRHQTEPRQLLCYLTLHERQVLREVLQDGEELPDLRQRLLLALDLQFLSVFIRISPLRLAGDAGGGVSGPDGAHSNFETD